jgi:hypothetical protein
VGTPTTFHQGFPYKISRKPELRISASGRKRLAAVREVRAAQADWRFSDNGFNSQNDMDRFHGPLVKAAREVVTRAPGNVIDLGCGNGALVSKVCKGTECAPFGIDLAPTAIRHAAVLLPNHAVNFVVGNIFDSQLWAHRRYRLSILMAGRLLEIPVKQARGTVQLLMSLCYHLLLYVYPGGSSTSLPGVARQIGINLKDHSGYVAFADSLGHERGFSLS